jgi:large subunit ribosomal protein L23
MISPYSILIRPLLTEDSIKNAQLPSPQYSFLVNIKANKIEIARAVEQAFGVQVVAVNTTRTQGKVKTMRRHTGKRADFKKAFVTLKPGNQIDLF